MKEIGGYFELELCQGQEYHQKAIRLNTGRNAFEYILRTKNYKKVFLPYFTCDVMLELVTKLNLKYEFYHIDTTFRPVFNFARIRVHEVFVYTNYFGICDIQVNEVTKQCKNLIIDNSQAFFSKPISDVDTFYSPRKYFGVPDGGYLYTNKTLEQDLEIDNSTERFDHLIGRIENGAEESYLKFKENEQKLCDQPIKQMSRITHRIFQSIDYSKVAQIRKSNFKYLHQNLANKNLLNFSVKSESVPLVYPFLQEKPDLRSNLIQRKVFVPVYWPNVLEWCDSSQVEYKLTSYMVSLPIDQRIEKKDLDFILNCICST